MEKILITGASGLLGRELLDKAASTYHVFPTHATRRLSKNSLRMNITEPNEVKRTFSQVNPDIVVHAAAETDVDKCENDEAHATRVNAEGTRNIAEACNLVGARIVYVSTDYVFDGERGRYNEEEDPNPINTYGLTKLMGERFVVRLSRAFTIVRTSVLYGVHPERPNFATWVIKALENNRPIAVVDDHFNSPTLAANLAEAILQAVERKLGGIYHIAGSERTSRYEFAKKVAETFNFDMHLIRATKMSELKAWTAKRPRDSSLSIDKVKREIDTELLDVTRGLEEMKEDWVGKN